ncbi:DUF262 domain-containing protein [Photobacterium leiognathi]|uniref:DUF262 domain-containing protein n=1 Tax=Photobacterium leiognathi TaxID=553611 RepID=UPI002738F7BF|nr:DUF262 domain-containing protein [Photobacterium leiognathi]
MSTRLKFDTDYDEPLGLASEETFSRINSYSISYSVHSLLDLIAHQEIELEPEFQRNFVWDKKTASLFIDSLLIGFPTPNMFFGRNSSRDDFIVIDGLQRLKTLYFFVHGSFSNSDSFRLIGLTGREWDGMSFSDLPRQYQRRIMNSIINSTVVDDIEFNPDVVHELFYRINTGGIPLTNQEVRNCVYGGQFNRTLHRINSHHSWRVLLGDPAPHKRLLDIESVLRILALIERLDDFRPPMREFISSFQAENRDVPRSDLADIFTKSCDIALEGLMERAFRNKKSINRTSLESTISAIGICLLKGIPINNLPRGFQDYSLFLQDNKSLLISGANTERSVKERVIRAIEFIGG